MADEAGIQRGDVIREINGQAIRKVSDYQSVLAKIKKERSSVSWFGGESGICIITLRRPKKDEISLSGQRSI